MLWRWRGYVLLCCTISSVFNFCNIQWSFNGDAHYHVLFVSGCLSGWDISKITAGWLCLPPICAYCIILYCIVLYCIVLYRFPDGGWEESSDTSVEEEEEVMADEAMTDTVDYTNSLTVPEEIHKIFTTEAIPAKVKNMRYLSLLLFIILCFLW